MQHNRVKAALKENKAVVGPIISEMRSIGSVRMMQRAGFDFLFLDMEHAMFNWETMVHLVQYALVSDIVPIVRPTDTTYGDIARALDTGSQGVIVPRVQSREQAEAVVQYSKYPPIGRRGAGGDGRNAYRQRSVRDAVEAANQEGLIVVQIESAEAVEKIDDIASVEGVDVLLIGPQDLSISLGTYGDFGHSTFREAAQKVADAATRHGKASGMVEKTASDHQRWYEMGMRFLVCNTDSNMLLQAGTSDMQAINRFIER